MASVCKSECIDNSCMVPGGEPSYVSLERWPGSDAERRRPQARVVDGISCRQMYLRSYTFSREDNTAPHKAHQKCFGKVRPELRRRGKEIGGGRRKSRCLPVARAAANQAASCVPLLSTFRRFICCVPKLHARSKHF